MEALGFVAIITMYAVGAQIGAAIVNSWFERRRAKRESTMKNITPKKSASSFSRGEWLK